jgi:uncharacterized protein (TIGR02145 family)
VKATNACGTSGQQSSTSAVKICPATVSDADGNNYYAGAFGAACWMTQNMRKTSGLTQGRDYYYPNGSRQTEYTNAHGLLYSWETASTICPTGWRLPTEQDGEKLIDEIGNDTSQKYATDTESGKAGRKMASKTSVTSSTILGTSKDAQNGGFDALQVGYRNAASDGTVYYRYGTDGLWWTTTGYTNPNNGDWVRVLIWTARAVTAYPSFGGSDTGYVSVRCLLN